jgi:hypothetical protein
MAELQPTPSDPSSSFDSQEEICPICLLPQSDERKFCTAPCSHRFCVPDAERVLLTKTRLAATNDATSADPHQLIPTLGRCPICRQALNLFDLQHDENGNLYEKNTDSLSWPVYGKIYSERNNSKGLRVSFEATGPTLSWYSDGISDEAPNVVAFQPGSHFHAQSRTFHGQIDVQQEHQGSEFFGGATSLTCIFQFSSDLRFIAVGALMSDCRFVKFLGVGGILLCSSGGHLETTHERPAYGSDTLWGNTFCQGFKVGLASYQFLVASSDDNDDDASSTPSTTQAYISYEHPISFQWPPLDDGSPVPARVYFRDISFDETKRIFRGSICWLQDYGTTWQGFKKWIYEMKFDSKFTFIASGSVHSILKDSEELHEMSSFGQDLIYINAAIDEHFRGLAMANDEQGEDEAMISDRFARLSQPLRQEWAREGASVRVIAMLHNALTKVVVGRPSPVDFNLST